jgi:L-threonylcarbamoyladenylate synthase
MPTKGCEIISLDGQSPDQDAIDKAATLIKKGGLVVFPTSTFYGLGVLASDANVVDSVFRIKKRDRQKPLLILIARMGDLAPLVQSIPATATRLMQAYWPGAITLVFEAADVLPPNLTGYTGKIGIRLAGHPVASALVRTVGSPITGTSANLSGKAGCSEVDELDREIMGEVDLVLNAGRLEGIRGSTVVDVTVVPPRILREGVVSAEKVRGLFE